MMKTALAVAMAGVPAQAASETRRSFARDWMSFQEARSSFRGRRDRMRALYCGYRKSHRSKYHR